MIINNPIYLNHPMSKLLSKILWMIYGCLLIPSLSSAACLGDLNSKKIYSVYVVPQYSISEIYTSWSPLLEKVGIDTRQCFNLVVPNTIPEFEKAVFAGKADFAYMNPYHEVIAYHAQGFQPLFADGTHLLDGIIVVRADSPYKTLADLRNTKIAFPSPNAFGASLLIRATLAKAGVPFRPEYVKSHSNVYRAVILGDMQAGGGIHSSLEHERPEIKEKLRVLYSTPSYRPHPFAAHPRVAPSEMETIRGEFIKLTSDALGRQLLAGIQMPNPVSVSYQKDYQVLEGLGLSKYVVIDAR